jgi:Raf kinase inhibitor-like YbhB/YbcL family protein
VEEISFDLRTDAIGANSFFDPRYTCDINNSSPELRWSEPPPETESYALIAEDLDVHVFELKGPREIFTHWLVYNIAPTIRHLPAGVPAQDILPNGIHQGINSAGKLGYLGPCPPVGDPPHRYCFRLFALNAKLEIAPKASRDQVEAAIRPHIIGTAEMVGRYRRLIQKAG